MMSRQGVTMVNLEASGLCFSYGNHEVLRDISFSMNDGELVGMLGANGAGKSTLFRCILGLEKNYRGKIHLDGQPLERQSPETVARRIAYVPQTHYPSFNYSAFDMVLMGTAAQGREWAQPNESQKQNAAAAMERLGIIRFADRGFRQLSGGEQQLVLIARALAQKATLLVMDEPTANLDYGNQIRVLTQIKELSRSGYGVLLSTHNPDHAFLFADRVLALHDSRLAASGPPAAVLTEELIKRLYNIDVRLRRDGQEVLSCVPVVTGK
jgi:iron complex transport system ATP-binding protein